jgi:hypothetical protein
MSDSRLLWINTDVKSYKRSKRMPTAQAAAINAHAQNQARAAKASQSHRALRESSVATAVVGWNRRSTTIDDLSSDDRKCQSTERDALNRNDAKKHDAMALEPDRSSRLVPHICGRDETLDPFDSAAAKIDFGIYDIIQFYLARVHPTSWTAKSYASARLGLDQEAFEIVKGCMADRARLYALVACTAAYMEHADAGVCKNKAQPSAFYLQNAIIAVREQVQSNSKESSGSDVLQSIVIMAVCAQFLQDYAASLAHLRATKHLIQKRGGLAAVESGILRTIVRADVGRAVVTLEAPVVKSPSEPMTIALPKGTCDAELERQSEDALLLTARAGIPKQMGEHVRHVIRCTRMLAYVWTHRDTSSLLVGKILFTVIATLYYLLSASFKSQNNSVLYDTKKLEATRVTLLLWTLLLTRSTRDGQQTYRDIPYDYEFRITDPEIRKRLWHSGLHDLLIEWNQAIRILNQSPVAKSKRIPMKLIRIVQAMEKKTDVKLGGLMERLFELEERHRSSGLNYPYNPGQSAKSWHKAAWPSTFAFNAFLIS